MTAQGAHVGPAAASPVQGRLRSEALGQLRRSEMHEKVLDQAEVELPVFEPPLPWPAGRTGPVGLVLHPLVVPAQVPVQTRILFKASRQRLKSPLPPFTKGGKCCWLLAVGCR